LKERFIISYDELPISVNEYLKPSAVIKDGKAFIHMYETQKAKDFKKRFGAYLKREVKKQDWDRSATSDGHWILECVFFQARTNQDNNNMYKILCDTLTGIVTEDDKNILVQTKMVMYDAKNPRFMAMLRRADYTGIFKNDGQYNDFMSNNCLKCKKNKDKCTILRKALEGRVQDEIQLSGNSYSCEKLK
jgi:Holliday junction resolvase RusA-like endonuclease